MHSAIYVGRVRHRRFRPIEHSFVYRLFLMYLDLDELPRLFDRHRLWGFEKLRPATFRRRDHFGDTSQPLDESVRELVNERAGVRPAGPIRLLTHLRYFGHCFNPVSFYYCFGEDGERTEFIVAEVTNTPWNETHCYVLDARESSGRRVRRFRRPKEFHVSPFMGMSMDYEWVLSEPGQRLAVHIGNFDANDKLFDATMMLERREISGQSLNLALFRYPLMTIRVVTAIYWQALRLKLKGVRYVPHPAARASHRTRPEQGDHR